VIQLIYDIDKGDDSMKHEMDELYRKRIGEKLKELRVKNHYTQKELAEVLHVSERTMSRIENGENSIAANDFILLMNLFHEDVGIIMNQIQDFHGVETFINDIFYQLERNPIENFDSVSLKVEIYLAELKEEKQLSSSELKKLEIIRQVTLLPDKKWC
jgi:transcriptional regulator with XRE-family HTH domain